MKEVSLHPLLLVTLLAFGVPILLSRLRAVRIPVVVGEIVCGIIVGGSGLNLIQENQWLDFLSLLGFAYLMFLAGAEIDFSMLSPRGMETRYGASRVSFAALAAGVFALTLLLSTAGMLALRRYGLGGNVLFMGLLLSTTSVGIVVPVLKETGENDMPLGQAILLSAVVADFATMVLITVAVIYFVRGFQVEMGAVFVLLLAFAALYALGSRITGLAGVRRVFQELAHAASQLKVRTAFALMLLFVVVAQQVGSEMILGAFLAGAIFSLMFRGESWDVELKLDAIGYGFFIPIFFIMVGVDFDLRALVSSGSALRLTSALVGLAFMVKVLPGMLLALRFPPGSALRAGVLLSSRLSLIIAAAEIGGRVGIIDAPVKSAVVIVALVTCSVSPVVYARGTRGARARRITVVVLGAGKVGRLLAQRLHERSHEVVVLDADERAIGKAKALGLEALRFDAATCDDDEALRRAGIHSARVFVAVTGSDRINLESCLHVRKHFGIDHLIARVSNPNNMSTFVHNNIRPMDMVKCSAVAIENMIYRPNVYDLLSHATMEMEVVEVTVTSDAVRGKKLKNLTLPGNPLILLQRRGHEIFVPHGETEVLTGDVLTIFVPVSALDEVVKFFEPGAVSQTAAGRREGI
ncbi:MAG: monovalent cation:proton antiporter family protein [bacterium]